VLVILAASLAGNSLAVRQLQEPAPPAAQSESQQESPARVRELQAVTQGLLLKRVNPEYPRKARKQHIQGTVVLNAKISKDGDIVDLSVVSGRWK
jgi:outer membrane biosynthesis protein TonB